MLFLKNTMVAWESLKQLSEENNLFHPCFYSLPFVLVVSISLWAVSRYIRPEHVCMIVAACVLWESGWHSARHHPGTFLAHWGIRYIVAIPLTGLAIWLTT